MDFARQLVKDDVLVKKLVQLTYSSRVDLKTACCFTLKNLLFRSPKDVKDLVMKVLTHDRLMELLDEEKEETKEEGEAAQEVKV